MKNKKTIRKGENKFDNDLLVLMYDSFRFQKN